MWKRTGSQDSNTLQVARYHEDRGYLGGPMLALLFVGILLSALATTFRRQQALAIVLAQNGIDELGFAARELAHEGQQDAVGAQLLERVGQSVVDFAVVQALVVEPVAVARDLSGDGLFPRGKGFYLVRQLIHTAIIPQIRFRP